MKFTLKTAGAAVALALAASGAHAALVQPNTGTGSDIVINIWDNDSGTAGFTQDTGLNVGSWNPANSFSITLNTAGSLAAFNQNSTGTFWNVVAAKGNGTTGTNIYYTSTQTNGPTAGDTGGSIQTAVGNAVTDYSGLSTHSGNTFGASSTGKTTSVASDAPAGWAGQLSQGGGVLNDPTDQFADSTGSSTSSSMFFESLNASSASTSVYNGYWTLSFNGTGGSATSATLTWTPTAVPLPAAVWLFGSGVLGLAGIGRRRAMAAA